LETLADPGSEFGEPRGATLLGFELAPYLDKDLVSAGREPIAGSGGSILNGVQGHSPWSGVRDEAPWS